MPNPEDFNPRMRVTSATIKRADLMRSLITKLREGEMLRDDMHIFLGFTPSGCRKYVQELREALVIAVVRYLDPSPGYLGHPVYALTDDEEQIAGFMASMEAPRPVRGQGKGKVKEPKPRNLSSDPTRHFHILADDAGYAVRVNRQKIPAPDPLLAAFYGLAGA